MASPPAPRSHPATGQWWEREWLRLLADVDDRARLQRGRAYARTGRVLRVSGQAGAIAALVRGRSWWNYDVRLTVPLLPQDFWGALTERMAGELRFEAALLAGELPPEVETLARDCGASLLPPILDDLEPDCTCEDWVFPCKHIIAVIIVLGEAIAEMPLFLLELRGIVTESLLAALRSQRPAPPDVPVAEPEVETAPPAGFWRGTGVLPMFPAPSLPPPGAAVLGELGLPAFTPDRRAFLTTMEQAYRAMQRRAGEALGRHEPASQRRGLKN